MTWSEIAHDVALATTPDDASIDRVRAAVRAGLDPIPATVRAEPTTAQVRRLSMRIDRRRRRAAPRWLLPVAAGVPTLAAAAMALWMLWPEPEPEPVSLALAERGAADVSEHVAVTWEGDGAVSGTEKDVQIAWITGRIEVEVEPQQGIELTVRTEEARVRVVGTAFTVHRGDLGTEVTVARGKVEVTCGNGSPSMLGALETHACLPTTAGGLLQRARALDTPEAQLTTADMAMALPSDAQIRAELLAVRFEALVKLERWPEALEAADAYLALGGPRSPMIRRYAAQLSERVGCERALPHLQAMGDLTERERQHLARCEAALGSP